jgi:hypothetical protein
MATHLIQIKCQEHLDRVRATHAELIIFFDNPLDSQCQKLRAPLLAKCVQANRLLVAVPMSAPMVKGSSGLPFVTVIKEADLAASLSTSNIEELWSEIEAVYKGL